MQANSSARPFLDQAQPSNTWHCALHLHKRVGQPTQQHHQVGSIHASWQLQLAAWQATLLLPTRSVPAADVTQYVRGAAASSATAKLSGQRMRMHNRCGSQSARTVRCKQLLLYIWRSILSCSATTLHDAAAHCLVSACTIDVGCSQSARTVRCKQLLVYIWRSS